jgi:hypothetical protein
MAFGDDRKLLSDEEAAKRWKEVIDKALVPYAQEIHSIACNGDVTVVVHEHLSVWIEALHKFGRDGKAVVFRLLPEKHRHLASSAVVREVTR